MSVLPIVGPKCRLAASHAASWWVTVSIPTGQTDRRTEARPLHCAFRDGRGQRNKKSILKRGLLPYIWKLWWQISHFHRTAHCPIVCGSLLKLGWTPRARDRPHWTIYCSQWSKCESKKPIHLTFVHNFGKGRPIYKILSLSGFWVNSLCNGYRVFHFTLTVLLHYTAKFKNLK